MRTMRVSIVLKLILLLASGWGLMAGNIANASVQPIVAQTIEIESIIGNWLMEVEAEKALDAAQAELMLEEKSAAEGKESVIETPSNTH